MQVIRLPDGTLRVPHSALAVPENDGEIIAHGYVDVRPGDPDYDRLLRASITEEEMEDRRRSWREEDEDLRKTFEEYKATKEE